ncbi:DUF58 domain-containing protein [Chitinimonas sp. BJB300]|uniref:DUF58 domain-containing protein n=1 Tax=Chitinimonas sp. BJB300 TaxID=1559339 RepID=UPI000C0C74A4|nr:DUF58 domain-containing protein [Chitinimonas sp. BJB300]PHV12829.1 hypothetical protein CSQ89_03730 [Chitinimonas sp. BJB300]TSJ88045.1 DUF58 domain-containing protein [Chitinimonas sp. BJB300]
MLKLPKALTQPFSSRWQAWLHRRHPSGRAQLLTQNRVYIFLSRSGLMFVVMTLTMLGGAINYDLALAYLLVFLLLAMALVSIFHTFRNLLGLQIAPGRVEPCFVGESARFEVVLENAGALPRHNIVLRYDEAETAIDVLAADNARVWLSLPAPQRGWLRAPRLGIETHWPLGVFRSWSYANFEQRTLIYPKPEVNAPPLPQAAEGVGEGVITPRGQDDFAGLRPFQRGDSPRHVAWKAAARDDGLMVKEFHGEASHALWLDWDALPPGLDSEARLARLTAWVLMAHAAGLSFGLSLPTRRLPPEHGDLQRDACLAALALYGIKEPE